MPEDFYKKKNCIKECKNLVKTILNQIMQYFAYLLKRMISGSIKPLQIKLLLSRMIFNNLTKLTNLDEKNQCKRLCFISVRVRAVLNYFF